MHYRLLAILEEPSIDGLAKLLEPYGNGREWDFYQVGGRFTGTFDGYDPEKDAANMEPCQWRHHQAGPDCPNCKGTGTTAKWPTRWVGHDGDQMPVSQLTEAHVEAMYAVVCDAGWFVRQRYVPWGIDGQYFIEQAMPPLGWIQETYHKGLAVVVDYHN